MAFVSVKKDHLLNVAEPKASRPHSSTIPMVPRFCPVCGSKERKILFEDVNRREGLDFRSAYWRCKECKMIYLDPAPDWAQFRRLYEEIFRELEMGEEQVSDVRPVEPFPGQRGCGGVSKGALYSSNNVWS